MRGWGRWEAKGGLNHPLAQGKSRCVHVKTRRSLHGSCLTPHAALLVHPSGTIHPTVKADLVILSPVTGLSG